MKGVAKKEEKLKGRKGDTLAGIVGDPSWGSQDLNYELTHSSKLNYVQRSRESFRGDIAVA